MQQLRQVLPAEVMDLVPSEFKRWAPCTACWAEDGMPCSLRGAALCLAQCQQAYTLSTTPEQRHWLSAAGMVVGCEQEAAADVFCVCRVGPMTPAQVEIQTEQVQFEEPALSAEQMSANQAGTFYICCCCAACACWHPVAHGLQAPVHLHAVGGRGSAGSVGGPVSGQVTILTSAQGVISTCIEASSRPAQTGSHALLHVSGFKYNSPSRLAGWHLRQCMSSLICPPSGGSSVHQDPACLKAALGHSFKSKLESGIQSSACRCLPALFDAEPLVEHHGRQTLNLAAYACSTRGAGAEGGSHRTEGLPGSPAQQHRHRQGCCAEGQHTGCTGWPQPPPPSAQPHHGSSAGGAAL